MRLSGLRKTWAVSSILTLTGLSLFSQTSTWPVPPPPRFLGTVVSSNRVWLSWSTSHYALQSATDVAGPYSDVSGATSPYSCVVSGAKLFFRLRSLPWLDADIGPVPVPGSSSFMANGLWVVSGSGTDIWDSADSCHFVRQPWSGDGSIVARVVSCQNTDPWAKAGVMVRSSLAPEAANYAAVVSPASGSQTQWRNTVSGTTSNYWASVTGVPYWVKVARRGDTFLGCVSSDGVNWTMLGGQTIPMTNALAGLVVSSHSDSLNTSIFDNVGFSSSIDPLPWMNADIGAVGEAGYINYNDGKFTIESFGFDCWAAQDQFHCLYRPIGTNATLTVRLTSMEPGDGWAKAGLMIRSDLSDAAAYSGTMFASEYGTLLQRRYLAETSTVQVMGPNLPLPCWLRVVRRGSLFYNYASSNGADWVQIGAAVTVYMGQTAYACVFVTTHNLEPAAMQKAQFESVSVAP